MTVSNSLPILLDEATVAGRLGLSRRTLQSWRVTGAGPAYRKIGRRVLYAESDLVTFVEASRRSHTSEGCVR